MSNDNNKRLFCKFENIIINLTTGVGQFVDPFDIQETYCVPTKTFSLSNIHDIKVRTDTDGKPTLIFINNLIPVTCEFTTFNSYFNLTSPPQDNVLYFYDVSLYTPMMDHLFSTWELYDKTKHRNDFQAIFNTYSDIIGNDKKYLIPHHSREYIEFDTHIYEDRFLVVNETRCHNGETLQVYEDLKIMFAEDRSFIRIIINKLGNGMRHWDVYSMELTFNAHGTFIDATEYQSPTVLEILRPPHDFISWIHEYVHNIGESIDSNYKD